MSTTSKQQSDLVTQVVQAVMAPGWGEHTANDDARISIGTVFDWLIERVEADSIKPDAPHWMGYVPDVLRAKKAEVLGEQ